MNIYLWNTQNPHLIKLKVLNSFLFFISILIGAYLFFSPLIPNLTFFLSANQEQSPELHPTLQAVSAQSFLPIDEKKLSEYAQFSKENFQQSNPTQFQTAIKIPSINLDSKIHSGNSSDLLYKGLWHKSSSGNPIDGSNMVVTAHRFMYRGNHNTFYHLPKVTPGEKIIVTWEGIEYTYEVVRTKTVTPDQISIESPTEKAQLTLYTCTPLWKSSHRFVVIAQPI